MTLRYSHLSVEYKRQAIVALPAFEFDVESQQTSAAGREEGSTFARYYQLAWVAESADAPDLKSVGPQGL